MHDKSISKTIAPMAATNDRTDIRSLDNTQPMPADTDPAETVAAVGGSINPSLTAQSNRVRDTRFGDYEILKEIARGGMGAVFAAKHLQIDRVVALKVIKGSNPGSQELERFQAEATAAAKLDHPGIVPIYDVGIVDGEPYFTMKLIKGQSLSQKVGGTPIGSTTAAQLVRNIADAISHAHEHGIIHRDLKPGNVLLDKDEIPLVTDFGLAKLADDDSDLTRSGQAIGTPSYMPPEQAAGQRDRIDVRCDVYSLGAVLYSCLTGRPPFQGSTAVATIIQVINDEPASPRLLNAEVPRDLDTICMKCLSKSPDRRYSTAIALREDLDRYLRGEPIEARPVGNLERTMKWVRRNPRSLLLGFAALCTLIGAGVAIYSSISSLYLSGQLETSSLHRSALQKSRQFLARDDSLVVRPLGHNTDTSLQLAIAELSLQQGKSSPAITAIESIKPDGSEELEYHLMRRRIHQHQREIDYGFAATVHGIDLHAGRLMVNAQYNTGQICFFDTQSLVRQASTAVEHSPYEFDFDGEYFVTASWDGQICSAKKQQDGSFPLDPPLLVNSSSQGIAVKVDAVGSQLIAYPKRWTRGKIQLFDLESGKRIQTIDPQINVHDAVIDRTRRLIYFVGASRDGKSTRFIAYSLDDWSQPTRENDEAGKSHIRQIELCEDGSKILALDDSGALYLYNTMPIGRKGMIGKASSNVCDICISKTGDRIAFGDRRGGVYIVGLQRDRKWQVLFNAHVGPCSGVTFDRTGTRLYSAGRFDGKVKEWGVDEIRRRQRMIGMSGSIQDVCYGPNGRWMIVADDDPGTDTIGAALVDRVTGSIRDIPAEQPVSQKRNAARGTLVWTGFMESGDICVFLFRSGQIQWRDVESGSLIHKAKIQTVGSRRLVAHSQSGQLLAVANSHGKIDVVDLVQRSSVVKLFKNCEFEMIAFGNDQNLLHAIGELDGTQQHLITLDLKAGKSRTNPRANRRRFNRLAPSPQKGQFALADQDGYLFVLDTSTPNSWMVNLQGSNVVDLQWNQDGSRLIALAEGVGMFILDPRNGSSVLQVQDTGGRFARLAKDDSELVIVRARTVRRFDTRPFPVSKGELELPAIICVDTPSKSRSIATKQQHD